MRKWFNDQDEVVQALIIFGIILIIGSLLDSIHCQISIKSI